MLEDGQERTGKRSMAMWRCVLELDMLHFEDRETVMWMWMWLHWIIAFLAEKKALIL